MITIPTNTNSRIRIPAKATPPKTDRTEDPLLIGVSIPKAAKMLGVSKATFVPLIKEGKVRTVRLGKRVIVSVQSLRDFVDGKKEPCDPGKE